MRNAFVEELMAAAETNEKIALVVGDLGYGVVEPFAKRFHRRFFNAGVAEQNMMGLAAGLASEGFHVFVYSIANFPTFRCAEQIRNDVDYHELSVTVVAVGGGLAYGNLGYSHHAVQDYALMRVMPHMLIAAPGDPMEVRACMRYLIKHPQPSYLRLGKAGEPLIHKDIPDVAPGRWVAVGSPQPNARRACVTTGAVLDFVHRSLPRHPDVALYTLPLWGMSSKDDQPAQLAHFEMVMTVEDHLKDAGFGSWMLEAASAAELTSRIKNVALESTVCGMVGKQVTLNLAGGLSEDRLTATLTHAR
jgi:transketolase